MKIALYYYSGAGNTECIAKIVEKTARDQGHYATAKRITCDSIDEIEEDFDVLGLGFPVHFRRAPSLTKEFLSKRNGSNKKIFTFCTKGLYSGDASRELLIEAKQKGFRPIGNFEIYRPGIDSLVLIAKKGTLTEKALKRIYTRNVESKIKKYIAKITINSNDDFRIPQKKWYTLIDRATVKKLENFFTNNHRVFVEKFNVRHDQCDLCLLCVNSCPNRNIDIDESRIRFGLNCAFCLRCIHRCPNEAIQIGTITNDKVRYHPVVARRLTIEDEKERN